MLAGWLLAVGVAHAQDKQPVAQKPENASGGATAPRPSFARNDAASRALFERLDKNRDGYLTGSELTSLEAQTANWLSVDRNSDGRISPLEFTAIGDGEIAVTRRP